MLAPLAAAAPVGTAIAFGRERSTSGELLATIALTACGLPVALAAGVAPPAAAAALFVWASVFTVATLAVRDVIARARKQPCEHLARRAAAGAMAAVTAAGALPLYGPLPLAAQSALLPMLLLALGLMVRPPNPKQLRVLGWALVAGSLVTFVILTGVKR
jgi:hypothetical protein